MDLPVHNFQFAQNYIVDEMKNFDIFYIFKWHTNKMLNNMVFLHLYVNGNHVWGIQIVAFTTWFVCNWQIIFARTRSICIMYYYMNGLGVPTAFFHLIFFAAFLFFTSIHFSNSYLMDLRKRIDLSFNICACDTTRGCNNR